MSRQPGFIGFSHNIPNNTISCFWYHPDFEGKIKEWNSLFKRYTQQRRENPKKQDLTRIVKLRRVEGVAKN
ncbi:phosphoribosyltransferase-like protein [Peribacillus butanolivorans]|uniref:phosphoribosyltransferase-like protein n=1 Tax=Peribacillus butanolivorans TaxID=421767 RepID=UPI003D27863D